MRCFVVVVKAFGNGALFVHEGIAHPAFPAHLDALNQATDSLLHGLEFPALGGFDTLALFAAIGLDNHNGSLSHNTPLHVVGLVAQEWARRSDPFALRVSPKERCPSCTDWRPFQRVPLRTRVAACGRWRGTCAPA